MLFCNRAICYAHTRRPAGSETGIRHSYMPGKEGNQMTIAEVAKKFALTPDTLRYYERIGLLPNVSRTPGGIRDYSEADCRWVEYIKCMRSAGVTVETLIEYVRLFSMGEKTIAARKKLLLEQREQIVARIDEMTSVLAKLDWKLDGYEERMLKYEETLRQPAGNCTTT